MRRKPTALILAFTAFALLSACQSSNLIELNGSYLELIKQQREIDGLLRNGLGPTDAATMRTGIQTQFAAIGDAALTQAQAASPGSGSTGSEAGKVKARRSEAALLSLAVRSYLSSGRIADHKAVAPSDRGIRACAGLTGLQGLPTTCGYFHIAQHVGAYNETIRTIRPVFDRARALRPGKKLATADGRALEAAMGKIISRLKVLTDTGADPKKIDWSKAAEGLRTNFQTQQNKFLCNAQRLQARIINAAPDPTWNPRDVQAATKKINDDWARTLSKRPGGFRRNRDCSIVAQL